MRVLLLKDVYKLGRAGDVKRVADGYGRNFLLPQRLAVLATPGALSQAEHIRSRANEQRSVLNNEMGAIAEKIQDLKLFFPAKASETGKLYGSITNAMIAEAISKKSGVEVNRRQIDTEPVRALGEHLVRVRLTVDLIPTIAVIVHREGEAAGLPAEAPVPAAAVPVQAGVAETPEPEEEEAKPEAEPEEEA
jgi:large subunit ribosomal protein L9